MPTNLEKILSAIRNLGGGSDKENDAIARAIIQRVGSRRPVSATKENDSVAAAIVEEVNKQDRNTGIDHRTGMRVEQPLVEEHPLAAAMIGGATGKLVGVAGNGIARGIDWVGRNAMPSTLLKGASYYLPGIAEEAAAAAPYLDAAALSYWSANAGNAALDAYRRGDMSGAATYGTLAALPLAAHALPRVGTMLRSSGKNSRFNLGRDVLSVNEGVVMDEPHSDLQVFSSKIKHNQAKHIQSEVVDLFSNYEGGYELGPQWKKTLKSFVEKNYGKELESKFPGITKFAKAQLNQINYNQFDEDSKKMYDFIKNSDEFKTMIADESDIFDFLSKNSIESLEYDFPGLQEHMLSGLPQDKLIEKYIKSHPGDLDYIYYSDAEKTKIDPHVFEEGLNDGLEAAFPGITEYVKKYTKPKREAFSDMVKFYAKNGDEQGLVDYLNSEPVKNMTLTEDESTLLSRAYNQLLGSFSGASSTTYPFFNIEDGYFVKDVLNRPGPLSDYIKLALDKNVDVRVKQSSRDAVRSILDRVRSGEDAPLELNVKDYFGGDVTLPEEWAAALRLPEARAAYPNGVDYYWRGNSAPVMYTGEFNTGYPAIFGGDIDMASGYNAKGKAYVGGDTIIPSTDRTLDPNMLLFAVPKGTILDLGKFNGAGWNQLPEMTPEGRMMQAKINRIFSEKKANAGYPAVLDKLDAELDDAAQWVSGHPFRFDSSMLRQLNPEIVPGGFMFDESEKFYNTDRLASYIRSYAGSKEFPFQGVLLRGIHDGAISGKAANEIIYNINAGATRVAPKIVSPFNPFTFDLTNGKPFASGGSIHIKPENRGKFTALKKRTGKSATWFKEHGTPAQRKMATFALNARKWKHGDGGPLDFSGITTTNNRPYNADYIAYIDAALRNGGMNDLQRASVLANIIEESGGNPFAEGPGGFYGLLQWSGERYPRTKETDVYKEIDNQVQNILSTAQNSTDKMSWTHGGKGSGYNSLKDAMAAYNGDVLDDVMRGYTLGYVRPAGGVDSYNNRLKVARQLYDMQGFRSFDLGGALKKAGSKEKMLELVRKVMASKQI